MKLRQIIFFLAFLSGGSPAFGEMQDIWVLVDTGQAYLK